jgi:hypothetical protein
MLQFGDDQEMAQGQWSLKQRRMTKENRNIQHKPGLPAYFAQSYM